MEWKNCKVTLIKNEKVIEEQTNNKHIKTILRSFKSYITFFMNESSIHGCAYIVNPLRSWIERFVLKMCKVYTNCE